MPDIKNEVEEVKKDLHVFYVLDTSGSMDGEPIEMLNHGMEETISALKDAVENTNKVKANLKIAVLEYNTNPKWVTFNGVEDVEDFVWDDLHAGGTTNFAPTLRELNSKLSQNEYLGSMTGAYLPIIIFMTDGQSTDRTGEFKAALDEINKNKWFINATKIGFAVGNQADKKIVADICGSPESVITTMDWGQFKDLIQLASVKSVMLKTSTIMKDNEIIGAVVDGAQQEEEENKFDSESQNDDSNSGDSFNNYQNDDGTIIDWKL